MAMTQTQKTDAYQFFIVAFGAVTGVEYMNQLDDAYGAGMTTKQIVNVYTTKPQFTSQYPTFLTNEQFAQKLIANVVGTSASAQALAAAEADVVGALNAGWSRGDVIFQIFSNLAAKPHDDAEWGNTAKMFANKVAVAQYLTEVKMVNTEDLGVLSGYLANVTADSDTSTPGAIEQLFGKDSVELTLGKDTIVATQEGLTFTAGLAQAGTLGNVSNTLESGDKIIAKGEGNTLKADLITTVTGGIPVGPAISATTENIQVVELRAQTAQLDFGGVHPNFSHIDAENMAGVKEWWTVNSRSDIQIEDVRTRPEDTLIGMRDTDPEVGFRVYFDPEQLENGTTVKNSALTLTLDKISNPGDLSDNVFNGVKFTLGGKSITLQSDAIGAATTHAELLAALEAAAADNADLAGVTAKLNPDNTITLTDAAGKEFGTGSWLTPTGDIPPVGDFKWAQAVGEPERGQELISTQVELDNVGRTSAGGVLDIGSLGDGGVQKFEVNVDRSSWLTQMKSSEHLNAGVDPAANNQKQFLEVVNLHSKGANGNLTVGTKVANRLDGRVENGLNDVRVVDGSAFKGNLNLGITLTDDALGRYLDKATAPVEFNYTGGQGNDLFNLEVDADVSQDPDFVLNVNMGAGDDRLVLLDADRLETTSVDGGTGNNTFVTNTSVGVDAAGKDSTYNAFNSFANFQNYEVEGGNDTAHNFAGLPGVKTVTVATDADMSTLLRNLPTDISNVSVSGKNQTIGNDNNKEQTFEVLTIEAAKAAEMTVSLDNTARVGGKDAAGNPLGYLYVDELNIADQDAATLPAGSTNESAVRTLNIVSNGVRQTANFIGEINAEKVGTFNLKGTQDLSAYINDAAFTNASFKNADVTKLVVDGSALTGKLDLGLNAAIVNKVNSAAVDKTVTLTGTAGDADRVTFDGAVAVTKNTTVSGFETVRFTESGGTFEASNVSGVQLYDIESLNGDLELNHLRSTETVQINTNAADDVGGHDLTFVSNAAASGSNLTLQFRDLDEGYGENYGAGGNETFVQGYNTVTLDLGGKSGVGDNYTFDFNFRDSEGRDDTVATYDLTKVAARTLVVKGGESTKAAPMEDKVDLGTVNSILSTIDVSGYKGHVTAELGNAVWNAANTASLTGNTVVKVGAFGLDFKDADHSVATGADTVTTFVFTADAAVKDAVNDAWKIGNFQGFNDADSSVSNLTILDLSALGVQGFADLDIQDVASGGVIIESLNGLKFHIELSGIADKSLLSNENFKFAA